LGGESSLRGLVLHILRGRGRKREEGGDKDNAEALRTQSFAEKRKT
jgi:hypothetical protein